jgi:hypothetical protein
MKQKTLLALLLALPLLWGCEPSDPGSPIANMAPDTRIVVAPLEGDDFDHYVSPESMFRFQWIGSDPDGTISGYYVQVDNGSWIWTTRSDSAIAFSSSESDPNNPGRTIPVAHTVRVRAVDDMGVSDASPATRTFNAINDIPTIDELVTDFVDGDVTGQDVSLSIAWSDSNISGAFFRLLVNGAPVTDWDSRSSYQFCNTSDPTILFSIDEGTEIAIDISRLPAGSRSFSAMVRDWGGAENESASIIVTVSDTLRPAPPAVVSTYEGRDYYPDGSIFYRANATTHFEVTGTAANYYGSIQAYQYRLLQGGVGEWSAWGGNTMDAMNLAPGRYRFEARCRDFAGRESDVTSYDLQIIEPQFGGTAGVRILIVDETKEGNGRPGSPDDNQADSLWRAILEYDTITFTTPQGWLVTELNYATHDLGDVKYVSPLDVYDKSLIIWHSDDKSTFDLEAGSFNIRLLGEYLDTGGRLFLSGWDLLENFTNDADAVNFSSGAAATFCTRYLRITGGRRTTDRAFTSATGAGGYPNVQIDAAKVPGSWNASLDRCWTLYPAHRTQTIANWDSPPAGFATSGIVMKNFSELLPWRTIVCGFPIYFLRFADANAFVDLAVSELLAP